MILIRPAGPVISGFLCGIVRKREVNFLGYSRDLMNQIADTGNSNPSLHISTNRISPDPPNVQINAIN